MTLPPRRSPRRLHGRTQGDAHGDAGVAAVEFALLLTVLLSLVALVAPISYLFFERVQLGRAAGDVIRFASSRSDEPRTVPTPGGSLIVMPGDLPSRAAVEAEAKRAATGLASATLSDYSRTTDPDCPSGKRLEITLTTTVDVGPFAGLLIAGGTKTLVSTATSCEE